MNGEQGVRRRNAVWTVLTTGVAAVLQLLQLMIAARYLDSYAFGALAIVNVAVWIVLAFQDMGLSSYCIHLGESGRSEYSTLFWISSALGVFGGAVVYALAYPVSVFYKIPELSTLLPMVGVNFILVGVSAQYQAHFVRCFRANSLAKFELVARLLGFIVAVGLLYMGEGVESIVYGLLFFSLSKMLFLMIFAESEWRPLAAFNLDVAVKSLKYGVFQAGSQVVNQLRTQADQLILGRALGPEALGVYSLAKELVTYPLRFAQPLFSRILLPALARNQNDKSLLELSFKESLRQTAVYSAIIYSIVVLLSSSIVEVMYGSKFESVAVLVPLIALFGMLRPLGLNVGMLAQAIGKTSNEFKWNLIASLISLPVLVVAGILWPKAEVFAVVLSVTQIVLTVLSYSFFVHPMQPVGYGEYVKSWIYPCIVFIVISVFAFIFPLPSLSDWFF